MPSFFLKIVSLLALSVIVIGCSPNSDDNSRQMIITSLSSVDSYGSRHSVDFNYINHKVSLLQVKDDYGIFYKCRYKHNGDTIICIGDYDGRLLSDTLTLKKGIVVNRSWKYGSYNGSVDYLYSNRKELIGTAGAGGTSWLWGEWGVSAVYLASGIRATLYYYDEKNPFFDKPVDPTGLLMNLCCEEFLQSPFYVTDWFGIRFKKLIQAVELTVPNTSYYRDYPKTIFFQYPASTSGRIEKILISTDTGWSCTVNIGY